MALPRFETILQAIATMEFDWINCPNLAQSKAVDHPIIVTDDLSVSFFDARHKPSGCKVTANDDSLAMAQASVAGTVNANAAPLSINCHSWHFPA